MFSFQWIVLPAVAGFNLRVSAAFASFALGRKAAESVPVTQYPMRHNSASVLLALVLTSMQHSARLHARSSACRTTVQSRFALQATGVFIALTVFGAFWGISR